MSIIKLGSPAVPVKITEHGTCLAKLEHIWRAARRYAKRRGCTIMENYGVVGVAPFLKRAVAAWLGYLGIPFTYPIHFCEIFDNKFSWVAEWRNDGEP